MAERGAEYVIEIATEMPDGASTIAELDALVDRLQVGGRKSNDFQTAIKRLNGDLAAAKAASAEAAAALAAGNDQYATLEKVAVSAAKALERAQAKGRFDPRAARAAFEAQTALDAYTGTLRTLEGASSAAKAKQDGLARSLEKVNKLGAHADARNAALSQRLEKLGSALGRLPGPLGTVGSKLVGSAKSAHELGVAFGGAEFATIALAAGAALAVAAVVALSAVAIAGAAAFIGYAVAQADAAREAALTREAFAALSAETAAGVSAFDAVTAETGLADAELVALTKSLRAAEVSAAEMPAALRAAAQAEAALGKGGASEFVDRIREGELAVSDFAKEAESKFGGVVAERMRGLGALGARLSKAWGKLFDGVRIEPFLDALGLLVGMFEKGHPLADLFGSAVTGAINPIADVAMRAAYAIEAFALDAAIAAVKVYLWWRKYGDEIKDVITGMAIAAAAFGVGWAVVNAGVIVGLAAQTAAWVATGVAAAAAWAAALWPVALVVVAIASIGYAIGQLINHWDEVVEGVKLIWADLTSWLGEQVTAFTSIGADLMAGLVAGITGAVSSVIDSVTGAVGAAITAAKEALGIASPSKVFAEIGGYTVEGFTGAVDDGRVDAQTSMAALVATEPVGQTAAPAGGAAASAAPAGGGKGGATVTIGTLQISGVPGADAIAPRLAELVTQLLEDDAASMSGATV